MKDFFWSFIFIFFLLAVSEVTFIIQWHVQEFALRALVLRQTLIFIEFGGRTVGTWKRKTY